MNRIILTITFSLCLSTTTTLLSQTDFQKKTLIASDLRDYRSEVQTGDIDGDGDQDYLLTSGDEDVSCRVMWLENDGNGNVARVVKLCPPGMPGAGIPYVKAADIDGDGDEDLYGRIDYNYDSTWVFWIENLDGQGNFGAYQEIQGLGEGSSDIYAEDFDQDGDLDLVADIGDTWNTALTLTWFENLDGAGGNWNYEHFGEGSQMFNFSSKFMPGDINNDGAIDIVEGFEDTDPQSGATLSTGVRAYFGDGNGNFQQSAIDLETDDLIRTLKLADLDQDGALDVLIYYTINGTGQQFIKWARNNGSGQFIDLQTIAQPTEFDDFITTADIGNDGDLDVLYLDYGEKDVFIIPNNGDGTFATQELFQSYNAIGPKYIAVADIDNNNETDLLVCGRDFTGNITKLSLLLYRSSNGLFEPAENLLFQGYETADLIWVDLDSDGDQDVVGVSEGNQVYWIEHLDGNGTFESPVELNNSNINPFRIVASDLDMDGDPDLVLTSRLNQQLGLLFNTDGQGTMSTFASLDNNVQGFFKPLVTDIDEDGDPDIIIADSGSSGLILYYENLDGQGNFSGRQVLTNALLRPIKMAAYDFNNDGDLDIIYHGGNNLTKIYLLDNLGSGVYSDPILLVDGSAISGMGNWDLADMDDDGNDDLICAISGYGNDKELFWLKRIANNGGFETVRRPVSQPGDLWDAIDHKAVDLDLDGDLDVVLMAGYFLKWYENLNGSGDFGPAQEISWANDYSGLDIIDVDGDLRPDLLTGAFESGEVAWFRNVNFLNGLDNNRPNLEFYPNPTTGLVTFVSDIPVQSIAIINSQGALLASRKRIKTIDLSNFQTGLYFARITLDNGVVLTQKIIKR